MGTNNPFSKLSIYPNYSQGHLLQWWVDPNFTGKAPYKFKINVYSDAGIKEPFAVIPPFDATVYVDSSNVKQNFKQSYYYKVVLIDGAGKEYLSPALSLSYKDLDTRRYLFASEIARKELIRQRYAGQSVWLLKRKQYSPIAISEVDPITKEPLVDTSAGSYGVGRIGGYYSPYLTLFVQEDYKQTTDFKDEGKGVSHVEQINARMPGFPILDVQDLVVCNEDKRYLVEQSQEKFHPGTNIVLFQNVTLRLIPNTDTVYHFNIPELPSIKNSSYA